MSEPRTDGSTRRKTWDRTGQAVNIKDTDVKSDSLAGKGVDPSYREYLAVLQEKNRILRELRKKEEKKREALAQRERGFEEHLSMSLHGSEACSGQLSRSQRGEDPKEAREGQRRKSPAKRFLTCA